MTPLHARVPAPGEELDWPALRRELPWIEAMHTCPQDPEWHAEGDVGVHTEMVLRSLTRLTAWRELPARERRLTWLACLLHDVAKPAVTRTEDGRVRSRGHSRRGAFQARRLLWESGLDPEEREHVCQLVQHHQVPFFLVDRDDARRGAILMSQLLRLDLLALVTEADARGRICADQQRLLDQVELFRLLAQELGCLRAPFSFPSSHARALFAADSRRSELAPAWDDTWGEVLLLSGLPGAGKDTWLAAHGGEVPIVSLDALRAELGVSPAGKQGAVVAAGQERARVLLRRKQPFAWNATNVSRDHRQRLIELFRRYGAHVRVVSVETASSELWRRNAGRAEPVPDAVLDRLIDRWSVPTVLEARALTRVRT